VKTGIWVVDGRWRQYESFSCNDMEPVHIHLYRSIPLTALWPELVWNLLDTGYAITQDGCGEGYVPETVGEGCFGPPSPLDTISGKCGHRVHSPNQMNWNVTVFETENHHWCPRR